MDTAKLNLEEQFNLPLTQELVDEVDRLRAMLSGTKLPDSQIDKLTVPHIFENKLLMNEGEHNGIYYPKEEILEAAESADEVGIVFDHLDTTQGEGASNWLGQVINPHWDDNGEQGPGLYGDLKIVDKACAQTLASGAKFGVSPAIDYQKNEVGGKTIATDLLWKSFSFVLSPAVRETMLNNLKKAQGDLKMGEPNSNDLAGHGNDKKYPYVKPGKEDPKVKKKGAEELMVDDVTNTALQARDKEILELREFKEKIELTEKTEQVSNLVASEYLIGRLTANELDDRQKALMEKSPEVLTELSEVIGEHANLASFIDFRKQYLKKNKGASMKEVAAAFKKMKPKGKGKGKLSETPSVDPGMPGGNPAAPGAQPTDPPEGDGATEEPVDDEGATDLEEGEGYINDPVKPADPAVDLNTDPNANANTATLTGPGTTTLGRGLAELQKKDTGLGISNADREMHAALLKISGGA